CRRDHVVVHHDRRGRVDAAAAGVDVDDPIRVDHQARESAMSTTEHAVPRLWPRMVGVVGAALLGFYYIGHVILGYSVFADDDFTIRVQIPEAAGVYADGSVTYRGVPVGQVEHVELSENGVDL